MAKVKAKTKTVTTLKKIAEHFKVSYSTVRAEWRTSGMPIEEDGTYDLDKIRIWHEARPGVSRKNGDTVTNANIEKAKWDALIKQEEFIRKKRSNEIDAGDYVPRFLVEQFFARIFIRFRDDLERVPLEMASSFPKSVRKDLVEQLKDRFASLLETIYRQRDRIEEMEAAKAKTRAGRPKKKAPARKKT